MEPTVLLSTGLFVKGLPHVTLGGFIIVPPDYPPENVSRKIVKQCRHDTTIDRDEAGYIAANVIISEHHISLGDLAAIVYNDEKMRLQLKEINGEWKIRATNGHSNKVLIDDEASSDPLFAGLTHDPAKQQMWIFHGTTFKTLYSLFNPDRTYREGAAISPMRRHHVHMLHAGRAPALERSIEFMSEQNFDRIDTISKPYVQYYSDSSLAVDPTRPVLLYIDGNALLKDGFRLGTSPNSYILSKDPIPARYIKHVILPIGGPFNNVTFTYNQMWKLPRYVRSYFTEPKNKSY